MDVGKRPEYPSDLSDEAWELIRPVLTAWKAKHPSVSGHAGRYEMREIVNAIFYQARTGCQWRYLPHDLPPKSAVYYYFGAWRDDGTAETIRGPAALAGPRKPQATRGPHRGRPGLPDRADLDERAEGHDRAG
ncbi:transposase, partial [Kitasatospora cinereorecta]